MLLDMEDQVEYRYYPKVDSPLVSIVILAGTPPPIPQQGENRAGIFYQKNRVGLSRPIVETFPASYRFSLDRYTGNSVGPVEMYRFSSMDKSLPKSTVTTDHGEPVHPHSSEVSGTF
jgi:hypothetical protein